MTEISVDDEIAAQARVDVPATLGPADEGWVLTLRRRLPQPVEAAWRSITEPDLLARWSPVVPDRPLVVPGPAAARENPDDDPVDATVLAADAPSLLEHRWGGDRLRWTLTTAGGGTDLELRQWLDDRETAPDLAAGWRLCLAVLAAFGDGGDHERVVGRRSYDYGWQELREAYAQVFESV